MEIEFFDLKKRTAKDLKIYTNAIGKVLEHGNFIQGPEVKQLEHDLASYVGAKYCITCANGTDALQIALMASEIGPNDEVIVPSFAYIAPAEAIRLLGAKPVFVDINLDDFNIDVQKIEQAITPKTKAIVVVSLFGQCADLRALGHLAKLKGLKLIEDAAQSFGAKHFDQNSCNWADISCTSFFPTKPLGCFGDGGAIFTNCRSLKEILNQISKHGQSKRYKHERVGVNSRLDTIQAAILSHKLPLLDQEIAAKETVARYYGESLQSFEQCTIPNIKSYNKSAWAQYTIRCNHRDGLQKFLQKHRIPTAIHYPTPTHLQPAYYADTYDLPNSCVAAETALSLPMNPNLTREQVQFIAQQINNFYAIR